MDTLRVAFSRLGITCSSTCFDSWVFCDLDNLRGWPLGGLLQLLEEECRALNASRGESTSTKTTFSSIVSSVPVNRGAIGN